MWLLIKWYSLLSTRNLIRSKQNKIIKMVTCMSIVSMHIPFTIYLYYLSTLSPSLCISLYFSFSITRIESCAPDYGHFQPPCWISFVRLSIREEAPANLFHKFIWIYGVFVACKHSWLVSFFFEFVPFKYRSHAVFIYSVWSHFHSVSLAYHITVGIGELSALRRSFAFGQKQSQAKDDNNETIKIKWPPVEYNFLHCFSHCLFSHWIRIMMPTTNNPIKLKLSFSALTACAFKWMPSESTNTKIDTVT